MASEDSLDVDCSVVVFLDTNWFPNAQYNASRLLALVERVGDSDGCVICPAESVWELAEHAHAALAALAAESKRIDDLFILRSKAPSTADAALMIEDSVSSAGAYVLPSDPRLASSALRAQTMQLGSTGKKQGTKTGAIDELILLRVLDWAAEHPLQRVVLATDDKQLRKAANRRGCTAVTGFGLGPWIDGLEPAEEHHLAVANGAVQNWIDHEGTEEVASAVHTEAIWGERHRSGEQVAESRSLATIDKFAISEMYVEGALVTGSVEFSVTVIIEEWRDPVGISDEPQYVADLGLTEEIVLGSFSFEPQDHDVIADVDDLHVL